MLGLPVDIWHLIILEAGCENYLAIRQVCKKLHRICTNSRFKTVYFNYWQLRYRYHHKQFPYYYDRSSDVGIAIRLRSAQLYHYLIQLPVTYKGLPPLEIRSFVDERELIEALVDSHQLTLTDLTNFKRCKYAFGRACHNGNLAEIKVIKEILEITDCNAMVTNKYRVVDLEIQLKGLKYFLINLPSRMISAELDLDIILECLSYLSSNIAESFDDYLDNSIISKFLEKYTRSISWTAIHLQSGETRSKIVYRLLLDSQTIYQYLATQFNLQISAEIKCRLTAIYLTHCNDLTNNLIDDYSHKLALIIDIDRLASCTLDLQVIYYISANNTYHLTSGNVPTNLTNQAVGEAISTGQFDMITLTIKYFTNIINHMSHWFIANLAKVLTKRKPSDMMETFNKCLKCLDVKRADMQILLSTFCSLRVDYRIINRILELRDKYTIDSDLKWKQVLDSCYNKVRDVNLFLYIFLNALHIGMVWLHSDRYLDFYLDKLRKLMCPDLVDDLEQLISNYRAPEHQKEIPEGDDDIISQFLINKCRSLVEEMEY